LGEPDRKETNNDDDLMQVQSSNIHEWRIVGQLLFHLIRNKSTARFTLPD